MKTFLITVCVLFSIGVCVLVAFLVFNRSRGIPIDLEATQKARDLENEKKVKVEVLGTGRVRVRGEEMSLESMEHRGIAERWIEGPGVLIVTFEDSIYADAIAVLDALRRLGIEQVAFQTRVGMKKKAAEPGATDNPGDAQRSREDH